MGAGKPAMLIPATLAIAGLALSVTVIRDAWQAFTVERERLQRERAAELARHVRYSIFEITYRPAGRAKEL
jgi:hypothetical protein